MNRVFKLKAGVVAIVAAPVLAFLFYNVSARWIPAGEVGLVYNASGGLDGRVYRPQRLFLTPWQRLYTYPTKIQAAIYTGDPAYGEERARSGSTPVPFRFVGSLGYRSDEPSARLYVRARHYRPGLARWQTVDPLWPTEKAYAYAGGNPTTRVDPSGAGVKKSCAEVTNCLKKDVGYDCKIGSGCYESPNSEVDIALALCVFYHENGLYDTGGPQDNGGGMGQHTCGPDGSIENLIASKCARGAYCCKGKQTNVTGVHWCSGAQADSMWMKCRGINFPHGYGNKTYLEYAPKIRKCAACVRNGGDCLACGRTFIGDRNRPE